MIFAGLTHSGNFLKCSTKPFPSNIFCVGGRVVLWSALPLFGHRDFTKKMPKKRDSRFFPPLASKERRKKKTITCDARRNRFGKRKV